MIHYGEEDENKNKKKKPLTIESLNEKFLNQYKVIKYFYSKDSPEIFINLIDKNEWTSERFHFYLHNCIHCVNEYLLINNIKPISFGIGIDIAYPYLCNTCHKEGKYTMYNNFNGEIYLEEAGLLIKCQKCLNDNAIANWRYEFDKNKKAEEEEEIIIFDATFENKVIKELGEELYFAILRIKKQNSTKYEYSIVKKSLIKVTEGKERDIGFVAIESLNENKIIEYGNEKFNKGSPVLREIDEEDKYLYHVIREFQLNINIDELFHSINLTPWKGNRYDKLFYNSYHFINIYLNKNNQKLVLATKMKSFSGSYLHLCRKCYKKLNNPDCYIGPQLVEPLNHSKNKEKEEKNIGGVGIVDKKQLSIIQEFL